MFPYMRLIPSIGLLAVLISFNCTHAEKEPFFAFLYSTGASSPYELSWPRELVYLGVSVGSFTAMKLWMPAPDPFDSADVAALDRSDVFFLDRPAVDYYYRGAADVADASNTFALLMPFMLLIDKPIRRDMTLLVVMWYECYFWHRNIRGTLKILTKRTRPFVYNRELETGRKYTHFARESFPSGHATYVSTYSTLAAKWFSDYHPESPLKYLVWGGAAAVNLTTGVAKVYSGDHFPTDVAAGLFLGTLVGWGIPELHKKRNGSVSVLPMIHEERMGMMLSLRF
ncbi:phosphatase PAP2 family protein, partial [Fibrobacterota bacterium]